MAVDAANSTFDVLAQPITFLLADGVTPVQVVISDLDFHYRYLGRTAISLSVQAGACATMFIVVGVLTTECHRKRPLFILNMLSLLFGFLRGLLVTLPNVGPFVEFYTFYSLDFSLVPTSAYAVSVTATIFSLLLPITVNASLVVQTWTVVNPMSRRYKISIIIFSVVIVLLSIAWRFAQTIINIQAILSVEPFYGSYSIRQATLITSTIAVWWFSLIFCGKLLYTFYNRRRRGWKQWSAVRILAIMAGCTMIIPSIFAVLQYAAVNQFPEAGNWTIVIVALSLPLSSLWAKMATDEEAASMRQTYSNDINRLVNRDGASSRRQPATKEFTPESGDTAKQTFQADTDNVNHCRKGSNVTTTSPTNNSEIERAPARDSTELDLEKMGVRVNRSYAVRTE